MEIQDIKDCINRFRNKQILIIGDVMIDHYLWGNVERISPEAPVPVVDVFREEYRLGGAANVALNIKTLGAVPYMLGLTGNDLYKNEITSLMNGYGIKSDYLICDNTRPTTLKSRVIGHQQQMLRIDKESKKEIDAEIFSTITSLLDELIKEMDCVIIQDYNKGMLTQKLIKAILDKAKANNVITAVDPKFRNFFEYKECTIFKPNFTELQKNTGIPIENEGDLDLAAAKVLSEINPEYLLVTRGEKGLSIYGKNSARIDIPTFAREIYDVSGAGDTVISTVSLGLCSGLTIKDAAIIANHAAGAVCGKVGIQPVYPEDIIASCGE